MAVQIITYKQIGLLCDRVHYSLTLYNFRLQAGGILCAAGFAIYFSSPSLVSVWLPLSLALMLSSLFLLGASRPDRLTLSFIVLIVVSSWVAVAVSAWQGGALAQSLWLAILTTALAPLAWTSSIKPVLTWLVPVWIIHALISLWQWLISDNLRVAGLTINPNVGAAFLLLGCVYLLNGHSKARWLMLPLVAAMPFTGSRWVAVVASVLVLSIFMSKRISWKYIAVGLAATVTVIAVVGWDNIYPSFNRESTLAEHVLGHQGNATLVLNAPAEIYGPSWLPRGFNDSGIHTVPWRMMHETGILSGLAWIGATAWGLWQRPRYDNRWWMLLAVGLLSLMYYHTWIGPLGGFWWLLVRPITYASSPD